MTSMSLAAAFWLGLHLIVAGPLRSLLVDKLGERYFFGIFSLLSIAGLVWFVAAYRMAPFVPLWPSIPALGWFAFVLVFLGFLLVVVGIGPMNPTDTRAPRTIDSKLPVYGITRVTRHPRLCGVSLWAVAHMLPGASSRTPRWLRPQRQERRWPDDTMHPQNAREERDRERDLPDM
jgi:uncharacterized membrane protein